MRILKITDRVRNDFNATLICERCHHQQKLIGGYDDENYHQNVLPRITCECCGQPRPPELILADKIHLHRYIVYTLSEEEQKLVVSALRSIYPGGQS